jgi:hypothetical protein
LRYAKLGGAGNAALCLLGDRFHGSLRYLQDSQEDWTIESTKMASLYEEAYLTIAASSSTGCDSFLRHKRDPLMTPISVDCTSIGGQKTTVKARLVTRTGIHEGTQHVRDPWDMRAWTLQEKLMSTRLVSYSGDELQWFCKTLSTCECGAALSRDTTRYPRSLSEIKDANNAYEFWQRQVMEYSRRFLTKPRDKLPAISGLARKIHNMTGSRYFAGLWLDNILRDLCWKRDRLRRQWEPPWEVPSVDRSPTFSWASVDGKVYYDFYLLHYDVTFEATVVTQSCKLSVKNEFDQFGEVESCSLEIRAPGLSASLSTTTDSAEKCQYTLNMNGRAIAFRADVWLEEFILQDSAGCESRSVRRSRCKHNPSFECTPVIVLFLGYYHYISTYRQFWLVLGRSRKSPPSFERLGFLGTTSEEKPEHEESQYSTVLLL